ncbi:hypothetical protein HBH97_251030 [Parastagonospora nodorum]|nr:hypothetical protein HBH97_251030 [Parastagonospora nodorum]
MLRTILTSTYLSKRRLESSSYIVKENLAYYNSAIDSNNSSNAAYISICYNYSTKAIAAKRKTY